MLHMAIKEYNRLTDIGNKCHILLVKRMIIVTILCFQCTKQHFSIMCIFVFIFCVCVPSYCMGKIFTIWRTYNK